MITTFTQDYSIITFATSKYNYVKFALNCARSILLFNDIRFYIVTDLKFDLPKALKKNVIILEANAEHLQQGTAIKLFIDQYIKTKYTLFLDADCLCYGSLQLVFDKFADKNISVVGNMVKAKDWCGIIEAKNINHTFGLTKLSRFNGGLYYVFKSNITTEIFKKAREIALNYDQLGFQRIHDNWLNEEILISIAMALYGELPVADNGVIMTDLYTDQHTSKLNVLTGYREIKNPALGSNVHRSWYPEGSIKPVILHFGSSNLYKYPYISQHFSLKLQSKFLNSNIIFILTTILVHFPFRFKYWLFEKLNFILKASMLLLSIYFIF